MYRNSFLHEFRQRGGNDFGGLLLDTTKVRIDLIKAVRCNARLSFIYDFDKNNTFAPFYVKRFTSFLMRFMGLSQPQLPDEVKLVESTKLYAVFCCKLFSRDVTIYVCKMDRAGH